MSISITVRNGTAVGQESLCRTCRHAHIQLGYSESEEEVRCGYHYEAPRLVVFAVRECSDYLNKLVPTLYEMEKMAFVIDVKKVNARAGFAGATVNIGKSEEDSE
ncbi:MAG TPA: hypothetical protein VKX41_01570 [Alloacidobacterium sp.]|jgi:hypothetical protein|nr:hypothetical protein [Alloacidobacterium sp.]